MVPVFIHGHWEVYEVNCTQYNVKTKTTLIFKCTVSVRLSLVINLGYQPHDQPGSSHPDPTTRDI
jgi:hypothetical protein